ncbi:MAG TPA: DUF3231 family protein [Metabacillus sp.]|nr:DUF3231 family protein [Metabacillus sp.]
MQNKPKIGSAEFGAVWMTYHKKTMILRMLEHFIQTSDDKKAKQLLLGLHEKLFSKVKKLEEIIQKKKQLFPLHLRAKIFI